MCTHVLCIRVCVCRHMSTQIQVGAHVHVWGVCSVYASMCFMYINTQIWVDAHVHVWGVCSVYTCVCLYLYEQTNMSRCMYMWGFVCVVCMCLYVYEHTNMSRCTCLWGGNEDLRPLPVFLIVLHFIRLGRVSQLKPELADMGSLSKPLLWGSPTSVFPLFGFQSDCHTHLAFTWALETPNTVLMLVQWVFCPLSIPPAFYWSSKC